MPILEIQALPQKYPGRIQRALKETCLAIAEAAGCDPKHVWATWKDIEPGFYFEGAKTAYSQPEGTHPPMGKLTCFEGFSAEQIEKVLLVASKTLSDNLGLNDNIFITYHEAKSGQVIAGNGIVRKS